MGLCFPWGKISTACATFMSRIHCKFNQPINNWKTHWCILSTVATDALVLYHLSLSKKNLPVTALFLTHWRRVTHICVGKLIIIGSDNGLLPDRCQAIIWTNARLLSIGPLQTYFNENLIKIQQFSLKKMHVKMSAKWRPSGLGLNVFMEVLKIVIMTAFTTFSNG